MKRSLLALIVVAASLSAPAMAMEHHGWLYNGSTGWASVNKDDLDDVELASSTNLGYRWGTWGVEGGYTFFNDFEDHIDIGNARIKTDLSLDGWTLGANVNADLSPRWSVQARGGAFFWSGDAHVSLGNQRVKVSDDSTDWYAGVALDYNWSRRASFGIAYTYYNIGGGNDFDAGINLLGFHSEIRF